MAQVVTNIITMGGQHWLSVVWLAVAPCLALHYEFNGMDMDVRVAELTVEIHDGRQSCFFMQGLKNDPMQIEYEIIEGGELDVDYYVKDPEGAILDSKSRDTFGYFQMDKLPLLGDYELCFSNEMSKITHKKVFFRWTMGTELADFLADPTRGMDAGIPETAQYNNIEYDVLQIRQEFVEIEQFLDHARNREHRHRSTVEKIAMRVWLWCIAITAVIIAVSIIQVSMIKSLFNTR